MQEYRSRAQFDDRISEAGWVVNTKERDHGEDVFVDVYDRGLSTGLSFLAQLKSLDNMERRVSRRDRSTVSYRLEVADLKHWQVSAILIVVVVWDVTRKVGVWLTVPEITRQLRSKSGWKKQLSVTVRFPCTNDTSDESLRRLRFAVAHHNLPIVSRGKKIKVSGEFGFPDTPEGRRLRTRLRNTLDFGERIRIGGEFIKQWKMSAWWERLFGAVVPEEITIVSAPGDATFPVRLEVDGETGMHVVELELRCVQAGYLGLTLSNDHQSAAANAMIAIRRQGDGEDISIRLRVSCGTLDVFQTRDATALMMALRAGRTIRFVDRERGQVIAECPVPSEFKARSVEYIAGFMSFLDRLCLVQARIHAYGRIEIQEARISRQDSLRVESFYEICTTGGIERVTAVKLDFDLRTDEWKNVVDRVRAGEKFVVRRTTASAGNIELFNVSVALGPELASCDIEPFLEPLSRAIAEGRDSVSISLPNIPLRLDYPNWAPATA